MLLRACLVALVSLAGGCSLNVNYEGTTFSCADGGTCPADYTCGADNICVPNTTPAPACSDMAAGGESHACSLRPDGTVWCWGKNDHGQLGNNSATD
ncbi:MAG TPA: hypothetical protein VL326_20160, partial [Kofleriaceae bacterium]|nr:hypothetical protein [Kofleriaceae bacterium]